MQLLGLDAAIVQSLDDVGGAGFRIRVARLTLEQHELDDAILVQIPLGVRFPVLGDQLALDDAGLLGVGAHVVGLVIAGQVGRARFLVVEDHGDLVRTGFLNHDRGRRRVNQVDGQGLHALGQQHVDLVVLLGLVVLGVVHQQFHTRGGRRFFLDGLAHHGHEVVVVLVDGDPDTGIGLGLGSRHQSHQQGGNCREFFHCYAPISICFL